MWFLFVRQSRTGQPAPVLVVREQAVYVVAVRAALLLMDPATETCAVYDEMAVTPSALLLAEAVKRAPGWMTAAERAKLQGMGDLGELCRSQGNGGAE